MTTSNYFSFSRHNRRYLWLLMGLCWLWSLLVFGLSLLGSVFAAHPYLDIVWIAVQLFAAGLLFIPVRLLVAEPRRRPFYWFWLVILVGVNYGCQLALPATASLALFSAFKSGLLLFSGTLVGAVLARYIHKLSDLLAVCIVMSLADFSSWLAGPTAQFAQQIASYYQDPQGPAPLIDMVLVKLALPGTSALIPVVGVSDWVMVSFFTCAAKYFAVKERPGGADSEPPTALAPVWACLPVPVVVLFMVVMIAHSTGLFIPVLPVLAGAMILWYLLKSKRRASQS